eukprot:2122676-Prorocentrum_lima.AAC.1
MKGEAPVEAYEWLNKARIVALYKPEGGLRPISILSAWRRVFLTAATRALRDRVACAAGHQ